MARRKKTRKRRSTAKRPVIIQLEAPKPKKRKVKRRRNPAAATVINPAPKKRRKRRKAKEKGLLAPLAKVVPGGATGKTVAKLGIGAGAGVTVLALSNKYLAPRIDSKWLGLGEIALAIVGGNLMEKHILKGSGMIFGGAVAASAMSRWIQPVLPFGALGGMTEMTEGDALADIEFVGGLGALDTFPDSEGDAVAAGDGGLEEVMEMELDDGTVGACVVDGLGILPPFVIGAALKKRRAKAKAKAGGRPGVPRDPKRSHGLPPGLIARLRERNWIWLLRFNLPAARIEELLGAPAPVRRRAVIGLKQRYKAGKALAAARGHRYPVPEHHPRRGGAYRSGQAAAFRTARATTPRPSRARRRG